jgi:hypothetical protein
MKVLLLVAILFLFQAPGWSAWTKVSVAAEFKSQAAITSTTHAFGASVTSGSLCYAAMGWYGDSTGLTSVTDTVNTVYALGTKYTRNGVTLQSAYGRCGGSGANTAAFSFASSAMVWVLVANYTGNSSSSTIDAHVEGGASNTTISVGPATTTAAGDLLLCFISADSSEGGTMDYTAGSGWTVQFEYAVSGNNSGAFMDQTAGAAGEYNCTATTSATAAFSAGMTTFFPSGYPPANNRHRSIPTVISNLLPKDPIGAK